MMVHHTRAVRNGTRHALVVADMPFLTFQTGVDDAVRNAGRLIQEGGAAAVKLEGGRASAGRHRASGRDRDSGNGPHRSYAAVGASIGRLHARSPDRLRKSFWTKREPCSRPEHLRSFWNRSLRKSPREITEALTIPTIGIGAGPHCDGQVLVSYDALGLFDEFTPSFVKRYAELGKEIDSRRP